jgi:NAD(P)-dependent dehydrogenase (short-subunit alcohol dehydrogenase family)
LGEASARRLAGRGAKISIIDRDEERGTALASEFGDNGIFTPCDVTDEAQVAAAVGHTVESFGRIDVVVNCAGIGVGARTVGREGPHSLDDFKRVMGVNVFGTFSVLSQAAAKMTENKPDDEGCRGVIVNTSSIAAFDGQIGQVAYAASKGAVVSMTLPIARDLASLGIRCCTICPGTFDTPMMGRLRDDIKAALAASIPNPSRLGNAKEYAMLVEQIISNPYLNGESIRLDGALRMAPK